MSEGTHPLTAAVAAARADDFDQRTRLTPDNTRGAAGDPWCGRSWSIPETAG